MNDFATGPAYIISISGPQTVDAGSSVTIEVTAGGIPGDFTYEWRRNGIVLPGQTNSTLTVSSVSTTDIGIYSCRAINFRGSRNSSTTILSVTGTFIVV